MCEPLYQLGYYQFLFEFSGNFADLGNKTGKYTVNTKRGFTWRFLRCPYALVTLGRIWGTIILRRTTLFQPISPPNGPCNAPRFSSETLALYKYITYLLTY